MVDNQINNLGSVPPVEIHTMPAQFLSVGSASAPTVTGGGVAEPKNNKKLFIIVSIVAGLIVVGAGVAVWLTIKGSPAPTNINAEAIVNTNTQSVTNENVNNANANTNTTSTSPLVTRDIGPCTYVSSMSRESSLTLGQIIGTNFTTSYTCSGGDNILAKMFKAQTPDEIDRILGSEDFSRYQPAGAGQENIYITTDKRDYMWISSNYLITLGSLVSPGADLAAVIDGYRSAYTPRALSLFSPEKLATDPAARDAKRIADITLLRSALEKFYTDLKAYPILNNINLGDSGYVSLSGVYGFAQTTSGAVYLTVVPKDPKAGNNYVYNSIDGKSYSIDFVLEKGIPDYTLGTYKATDKGINKVNENINVEIASSLDSDRDGLTDVEESLLGTNSQLADTDGDTYSDLAELESGYDPAQKGKKLVAGKLFTAYSDATNKFSVNYPTKWAKTVDDGGVTFLAEDGEFVQVIIQDNPQKLLARDWYMAILSGQAVDSSQIQSVVGVAFDAVYSLNKLNVYIAKDDKIAVLSYNIGTFETTNFKAIFNLMVKSWKWL